MCEVDKYRYLFLSCDYSITISTANKQSFINVFCENEEALFEAFSFK